MSKLIKKCEKDLLLLSKANKNKKRKIIRDSKTCLIKAISEISKNCIHGNVNMSECLRRKLKKYRELITILSGKKYSLEKKRNIIIQKGTGFLSLLIPVAIETAREIYEKLRR